MVNAAGYGGSGFLDVLEGVEPDAFLFEGTEEPLAQDVLLRGIRPDVFLFQAIILDRGPVGSGMAHRLLGLVWY